MKRSGQAGFTLTELVISTAIMLVVTGAIFQMVNPAQGTSQAQPEVSDMQQRMRVGVDMLYKDLLMAGAGPYQGQTTGNLTQFFAPILPYRVGRLDSDPASNVYYRPDRISMVYVPNTSAQTTITSEMPNVSAELKVKSQANCPQGDALCGFKVGMSLLIFDPDGSWDSFAVTNVQSSAAHLQHRGQQFTKTYNVGANVTQAEFHAYYFDPAQNQLRHYDGLDTDVPVVDNVVGLNFRYYGDPNPPRSPRPPAATANCIFDATGTPILPTLTANAGGFVELTQTMLTDGPWCPNSTSPNRYDADLLRVRKVRVSLRVQAASSHLRGSDTALFRNPGSARGGERFVPDYDLTFEVTPRNLNLTR